MWRTEDWAAGGLRRLFASSMGNGLGTTNPGATAFDEDAGTTPLDEGLLEAVVLPGCIAVGLEGEFESA